MTSPFGIEASIAVLDAILERKVTLPWLLPNGHRWDITIRPHDYAPFDKARREAGVTPLPDHERPDTGDAVHQAVKKSMGVFRSLAATGAAPVDELGFDREGREYYTTEEIRKVAPWVRMLVVRVEEVDASDEIVETTEGVDFVDELDAAFCSTTRIPPYWGPPLDENEEEGDPTRVRLHLAGRESGIAWSAFVLSESLKSELFRERAVPLAPSSDTSERGPTISA